MSDALAKTLSVYSREYATLNELHDRMEQELAKLDADLEDCKDAIDAASFALNDIQRLQWLERAKRHVRNASITSSNMKKVRALLYEREA